MMDKSIFGYDPLIGCPFDDSEMNMVESSDGLTLGDRVEFQGPNELGTTHHPRVQGEIIAIGSNAKYLDGTPFTALAVRVENTMSFKTHRDVIKVE